MAQVNKKIYLTKGDDTNFNEDKFLRFDIKTTHSLEGFSALFKLGGNEYTFDDISSKSFEVTISAKDTENIPYGLNMGSVYLYDREKRRKTLTISIPFQVEKKPTSNVLQTLEVVTEPVVIELTIGDTIPTKTSDLVNDSGFITKDVEDLTYYLTAAEINDLLVTKIDKTEKGVAEGVATLDETGKLTNGQLPEIYTFVIDDNNVDEETTYSSNKIEESLALKTNEANAVHNTGDETIEGVKTFIETIKGTAEIAINDSEGNNIAETYAKNTSVPTKTSELTNDSNFVTTQDVPTKTSELTNDSNFMTVQDIPKNLSDYNNDTGFITKDEQDLTYYLTAAETNDFLNSKVGVSEKGMPNGVATLDENGKIPAEQVESVDVIDDTQTTATTTYSSEKVTNLLEEKADNASVVHLTGDETINGIKTFSADVKIGGLQITHDVAIIGTPDGTIIRNTTTGETVVSNVNGSTNGLYLRPNGTDNSEGQVLINKDGTITGNLTGNADTATTATKATQDSEGNNIVDTYANQTFTNLSEQAEGTLRLSKAYLADKVYTDTRLFNSLFQQKQLSTVGTGVDIIKALNYTLIGTPTVSADGIASGFTSGSAIKTPVKVTPTTSFEVHSLLTYNTPTATASAYVFGDHVWRVDISKTDNKIIVSATDDLNNTARSKFTIEITDEIEDGTVIEIIDRMTKTKRELQVIVGDNVYSGETTFAAERTFTETEVTIGSGMLNGVSSTPWNGSVDLNEFKVYVDDELYYQPCLIIPYTLLKTGSKVVDGQYRPRVFDLYEQEGMAMYYTLDTNDNTVTVPLGDIYGMFATSKNLGKLSDLQTTNKKDIVSAINELSTKIQQLMQ